MTQNFKWDCEILKKSVKLNDIEYVYMPLDNVHYDVKMTSFYYVRNTKNVEYDVIMYIIEWHENELKVYFLIPYSYHFIFIYIHPKYKITGIQSTFLTRILTGVML